MELALFQIGKETVFPKILKYLLKSFNISLAGIFVMNQNIVQVYLDKNIKFFD